jgi:hypothetical protein
VSDKDGMDDLIGLEDLGAPLPIVRPSELLVRTTSVTTRPL